MTASRPSKGPSRVIWMALGAAALFLLLSTPRLTQQGLYYDEVHQATASFAWLGVPCPFFALLPVFGRPLLNATYTGAVKTAIYGLYLRCTGASFTVQSWRILGPLFVAGGLLAFGTLARRAPLRLVGAFFTLFLLDSSLLLMTRHDWGPVALGLCLRLVLAGLWLRAWLGSDDQPGFVAAGAVVGFSIFEKLSSVVTLIPLTILVFQTARLRSRAALASFAGFAIGIAPLVVVNLLSIARSHRCISLLDATGYTRTWNGLTLLVWGYVSCGSAEGPLRFILDLYQVPCSVIAEAAGMLAVLALALGSATVSGSSRWWRLAASAFLSWLGIGVGLYLLPKETSMHHWVIGAPFQYLGAAAACAAVCDDVANRRSHSRRTAVALSLALALLLLGRLPTLVSVERALVQGRSSHKYSPSLTRLAEFAARQDGQTLFVATDWGVATQIDCLAQGAPGRVVELFWSYRGIDALERLTEGHSVLYLVRPEPAYGVNAAATAAIESDAGKLPGWREASLESELQALPSLSIRKLVREAPRLQEQMRRPDSSSIGT